MPENPEVWKAVAMQDHFEKIQKLPDKVDGVPNFRRVPGYKVFCCGQPTKEGFVKAIEKAIGDKWPKDGPIVWLNMRQEAIVYINGQPVCARPPGKIGEYAELGNVTRKSLFSFPFPFFISLSLTGCFPASLLLFMCFESAPPGGRIYKHSSMVPYF